VRDTTGVTRQRDDAVDVGVNIAGERHDQLPRSRRWGGPRAGDAGTRAGWRRGLRRVGVVVWQRPVPLVGDVSTASQRAADPGGWALPAAQREALYAVIAARRDVRRFRPDPVPAEVLDRVLGAAPGHVRRARSR